MKIIDTRNTTAYSPLIPAIEAICCGQKGESIMIVTDRNDIFTDLKEYLSEQGIGFREIYDGGILTLQFTLIAD